MLCGGRGSSRAESGGLFLRDFVSQVVSATGEEVFFKIKRTTKLSKLQGAYANKVGKDVGGIRCGFLVSCFFFLFFSFLFFLRDVFLFCFCKRIIGVLPLLSPVPLGALLLQAKQNKKMLTSSCFWPYVARNIGFCMMGLESTRKIRPRRWIWKITVSRLSCSIFPPPRIAFFDNFVTQFEPFFSPFSSTQTPSMSWSSVRLAPLPFLVSSHLSSLTFGGESLLQRWAGGPGGFDGHRLFPDCDPIHSVLL
jgi:hypothetical protein